MSTDTQELARQIDALKMAGCARIYLDKASGKKGTTRPGLTAETRPRSPTCGIQG